MRTRCAEGWIHTLQKLLLTPALSLSICSASGQILFHTDFDEADLASTGLTTDTPNSDIPLSGEKRFFDLREEAVPAPPEE